MPVLHLPAKGPRPPIIRLPINHLPRLVKNDPLPHLVEVRAVVPLILFRKEPVHSCQESLDGLDDGLVGRALRELQGLDRGRVHGFRGVRG